MKCRLACRFNSEINWLTRGFFVCLYYKHSVMSLVFKERGVVYFLMTGNIICMINLSFLQTWTPSKAVQCPWCRNTSRLYSLYFGTIQNQTGKFSLLAQSNHLTSINLSWCLSYWSLPARFSVLVFWIPLSCYFTAAIFPGIHDNQNECNTSLHQLQC